MKILNLKNGAYTESFDFSFGEEWHYIEQRIGAHAVEQILSQKNHGMDSGTFVVLGHEFEWEMASE